MYYLDSVSSTISGVIADFIVNEVTYGWNMAEMFQHLDTALIAKGHITAPLAPEAFVVAPADPLMNQILGKMNKLGF